MANHIFGHPYIYALQRLMTPELTPAEVFKCLADETRARITLLIASRGELCVCELTVALDQNQPKVSRHLAQLRSCALLEDRRQGQWVYYRLHPELPAWIRALLTEVAQANSRWLACDNERLQAMRDRSDTSTCS